MALPLYDSQPARRPPVVTYLLVAVNVVIFLFTPMASVVASYGQGDARDCAAVEFVLEHGAVPKELTTGEQQAPPERVGPCLVQPYDKVPWVTAFTSMFLHSDWLHLTGNVVMLFVMGAGVEDRLGRLRYLLAYLLFGLVAVYGFALASPDSTVPLIGASGAIAGVLGAYMVLNPRGRIVSFVAPLFVSRLPAWVMLGLWFVIQWWSLEDEDSNVAYVAHIYGFVAGVLFALLARRAGPTRKAVALAAE
ncbi:MULTISPECIES: rhomboid family intramembrane serine protease [Thermomonospora]|uniref:Membrane associated rhomboid family serine protease n=1 Tax=Thermomonospora cellulosilytica TaxID=1411118 RepID=A0A7W3RAQ9_9ACTN|nr:MULTISPECIES: rhomboid family intramembrane serine protease [Thermomonospora]MBA9006673.1 membrane associated rhomboid family serine protease [Thermomonospora cellulosilytica]